MWRKKYTAFVKHMRDYYPACRATFIREQWELLKARRYDPALSDGAALWAADNKEKL